MGGVEHEPVGVVRHRAATHDVDRLRLVARDRAVGGVVGALTRCDVPGGHGGMGAEQAAVCDGAAGAVGVVQARVDGVQLALPVGLVELPPAAAELQQHLGRAVVVQFADRAALAVRHGRVDLYVTQSGERHRDHGDVRGELLAYDGTVAALGHGVHPYVRALAPDVLGVRRRAVGVVVLDARDTAVEPHVLAHAFEEGIRQYGRAALQLVEGRVGADEGGADEAVDEGQREA